MFIADVAVVAIDYSGEAAALRAALEVLDVHVSLFPVGCAQHLVRVLDRGAYEAQPPQYFVLSAHGDERGFLLPELAEEVAAEQPFNDALTIELARTWVRLPAGCVVISTACATGTSELADAFISEAGGCDYYVAPTGYADAGAAFVFVTMFFYWLLNGEGLVGAFERARAIGTQTAMFKLFRAKP
jgi:hypothetical protein